MYKAFKYIKILSKMWYYECIICIPQTQRGKKTNERKLPNLQNKGDSECSVSKYPNQEAPHPKANLQITIGAVPEPSLIPRFRPVSRPANSWSTAEEVEPSPPSYQDVSAGRFEARPVNSPLEEEVTPTYEPPEPIYAPESRSKPRGNAPFSLTV